jgi:hypothetical protein
MPDPGNNSTKDILDNLFIECIKKSAGSFKYGLRLVDLGEK